MSGDHDRYAELAVGHVLGGLDEDEAAEFRSHLLDCRDCRLRVAELRDLASDLADAERHERAQLQTKTEVRRRDDGGEARPDRWRPLRLAGLVGGGILVLLALPALLFWNLHLRSVNDELLDTAEVREATLRVLATGEMLPATVADGVVGIVTRDGDEVALSLAGIPEPSANEVVAVWLLPGTGPEAIYGSGRLPEGRLASMVTAADAERLVVTVEQGRPGPAPDSDPLLEVMLDTG